MLSQKLYSTIEDAIAACEKKYHDVQDDSYLSHTAAAHLKTLRELQGQLTEGMAPEELLASLREKLPELIAYRDAEFEHPTFDWYNEHYYYLRADGECDAYQEMIGILENCAKD